jgi:hypothetical protein
MPNPVDTQTDDTTFIGSHEKAMNGYGQNGYQGASSDMPGQHTTSGFLPQAEIPASDWQMRKVSKEGYAPSFGMKSPAEPAKVPSVTTHRTSKQAAPGSFQR